VKLRKHVVEACVNKGTASHDTRDSEPVCAQTAADQPREYLNHLQFGATVFKQAMLTATHVHLNLPGWELGKNSHWPAVVRVRQPARVTVQPPTYEASTANSA
jgi:hypothetical protein